MSKQQPNVDETVQKLKADLSLDVGDFTPRKLKLAEWDLNAASEAQSSDREVHQR